MKEITCPNCYCRFDPKEHPAMPGAKSAGTLTGVAIGARIGMLAGPAGLIAGAVVGGLVADNYMPKNSQCPCCDEVIPLD